MDLREIRDRIDVLHERRLNSPLDDDELDELRALYDHENRARQTRPARGD